MGAKGWGIQPHSRKPGVDSFGSLSQDSRFEDEIGLLLSCVVYPLFGQTTLGRRHPLKQNLGAAKWGDGKRVVKLSKSTTVI